MFQSPGTFHNPKGGATSHTLAPRQFHILVFRLRLDLKLEGHIAIALFRVLGNVDPQGQPKTPLKARHVPSCKPGAGRRTRFPASSTARSDLLIHMPHWSVCLRALAMPYHTAQIKRKGPPTRLPSWPISGIEHPPQARHTWRRRSSSSFQTLKGQRAFTCCAISTCSMCNPSEIRMGLSLAMTLWLDH